MAQPKDPMLRIVMLGDRGHHRPADLAGRIVPVLATKGIDIQYTEDISILDPVRLKDFDGLLIFANIDEIKPEHEKALLDFVAGGKGLIPLHCASFCFRNSNAYVELVGAQFRSHGTGEFETTIVANEHPIMKDFGGFRSWDETYVHARHNERDRVVLEERREKRGNVREPWTWVRTHGNGRVFYTAWGHDHRTWTNPGFHNLIERGIRWACGRDPSQAGPFQDGNRFPVPAMTALPHDLKAFTYTEVGAKIPNYTPSERWGVQGAPHTQMQDPLPPEESIRHYITPQDFAMSLWVSEPQLQGKPIAMNWDERGRLWVCETVDYPNELQPPGGGRDRIRIAEDTDADGKADRFHVFAQGLSIPTSILCYRGGAVVQDGVKTIYLKDVDGDDVADLRQELITGWAMNDTHGGVSNFQYGLDNWIWAMQGYNDSHPDINGQRQQGFRQGFWRFRLEAAASDNTAPAQWLSQFPPAGQNLDQHTVRVKELEFVRATNNNTWGLGISEEGLIFGSTANRNPSNFMPIANRYYERVKGWSPRTLETIADTHLFEPIGKIRQVDHHGGYTAGAGHALYTARAYPKAWWNRVAFVCGPTGHLVGTFVLDRDGSGYKSTSPFNLIASNDEWSSPIMAEVGPDGQVWVIDWYNYIVQHNPTPQGFSNGKGNAYESDLRDKKHGRIYRVEYRGGSAASDTRSFGLPGHLRTGLSKASDADLIATLRHSNMLWRRIAQRLLVERHRDLGSLSAESVQALLALVQDSSTDGVGLNAGAIHALWTLHGMSAIDPQREEVWKRIESAMMHASPGVRKAAIDVLPPMAASLTALRKAGSLKDTDAQVRLSALLKCADIPGGTDAQSMANSLMEAIEAHGRGEGSRGEGGSVDRWWQEAWTSAAAIHYAATLPVLARQGLPGPRGNWPETWSIIAEHAARSNLNSQQLEDLLAAMLQGKVDSAVAITQGLSKGWPKDHSIKLAAGAQTSLTGLLDRVPNHTKGQIASLAQRWGADGIAKELRRIAADLLATAAKTDASDESRVEAAQQFVLMVPGDDESVTSLIQLIGPKTPPLVVRGILNALVDSRSNQVGPALIDLATKLTPESKAVAMQVLMARQNTAKELVQAIADGKLAMADLALDQRQALRDHPNSELRQLANQIFSKGGGIPNADRQKVVEQWMAATERPGSAANGKELYKKHCSACHQHSGEGQNIGPDLTGMAVHPKHELLTHVLDPNRSVEGNFRTYSVLTTEGIVLTGMLAGESKTSMELINAQGKRETIQRDEIERLSPSQKSLMPEGFEGQMTQAEMTDLLEFLTSKGKYVPLSLGPVASAISTRGLFHDGDNGADRLIFREWKTTTIDGIPFALIDPQGKKIPNIVLLHGPRGTMPPKMPKQVEVVCNAPAAAIHILGGISGWGFPAIREKKVSMIVRLEYADGATEDHPLRNGVEMADYNGRQEVSGSKFAIDLAGRQVRYLKIHPKRTDSLKRILLVKGEDETAPIVLAMTLESP